MSYRAVLIFPHQLFEDLKPILPSKKDEKSIYFLVEEPLFFSDKQRVEKFQGLKLVLHRASMKMYEDYLTSQGLETTYIEFHDMDRLHTAIAGCRNVLYYDVVDHLLQKRIDELLKTYNKKATMLETQLFICQNGELDEFVQSRKDKKRKYFQTDFYRWQRKRLNILMDEDGDYLGGKLSYDKENRSPMPKSGFQKIKYHQTKTNEYIQEAQKYVSETFEFYGNVENIAHIAFDFAGAKAKLRDFLRNRLFDFGNYEDAIDQENPFVYHSILSSSLNIGIITPGYVVDEALKYYYAHSDTIGINDIEGFIRQIIGWREYYRMVYVYLYDKLVGQNLLGNTRELTELWYSGETGIEPVDESIQIAFKYGYLHHIIRLMIVGQFMLLCEIHPKDIYRWFMEFAIDSYDWVMIPNVYGMVGYNDGGGTTTKPYVSSSNYVLRMSNFKKGNYPNPFNNWDYIWRAMYYRFIHENADLLNKNPRTKRMVWQMNKLKGTQLEQLLVDAEDYIEQITNPE